MSDREWHFYLDDMLRFAENVLAYCDGLDQAAFEITGLNYDATVRNLELIGEAATHIKYGKLTFHSPGDRLLLSGTD